MAKAIELSDEDYEFIAKYRGIDMSLKDALHDIITRVRIQIEGPSK